MPVRLLTQMYWQPVVCTPSLRDVKSLKDDYAIFMLSLGEQDV